MCWEILIFKSDGIKIFRIYENNMNLPHTKYEMFSVAFALTLISFSFHLSSG